MIRVNPASIAGNYGNTQDVVYYQECPSYQTQNRHFDTSVLFSVFLGIVMMAACAYLYWLRRTETYANVLYTIIPVAITALHHISLSLPSWNARKASSDFLLIFSAAPKIMIFAFASSIMYSHYIMADVPSWWDKFVMQLKMLFSSQFLSIACRYMDISILVLSSLLSGTVALLGERPFHNPFSSLGHFIAHIIVAGLVTILGAACGGIGVTTVTELQWFPTLSNPTTLHTLSAVAFIGSAVIILSTHMRFIKLPQIILLLLLFLVYAGTIAVLTTLDYFDVTSLFLKGIGDEEAAWICGLWLFNVAALGIVFILCLVGHPRDIVSYGRYGDYDGKIVYPNV